MVVNLKERTLNEMSESSVRVVKLGSLTIQSYAEDEDINPEVIEHAEIRTVDWEISLPLKSTKFHLQSNLEKDESIASTYLNENQLFILDNDNFNILIYSTPTVIDRIDAVESLGT